MCGIIDRIISEYDIDNLITSRRVSRHGKDPLHVSGLGPSDLEISGNSSTLCSVYWFTVEEHTLLFSLAPSREPLSAYKRYW
jgi:hypothetical protein